MQGSTDRVAFQQRRAAPARTNNSVRRTYDLLRSSLHHSLPPGCSLVEEDLVDSLSSSRNTVRAALQLLAQEGLVVRRPKVGTTSLGSTLLPFNDLLDVDDKAAYRIRTEVLETSIIPAPRILQKWLHLPPTASVALVEGLVFQDRAKIGLSVSYVGLTVEEAEAIGNDSPDPITLLERVLEVSIGDAETTVATVAADAQSAELLGIAEGTPMLWLEDLLRDVEGRARAISQFRYRGDRVALSAIARRRTIAS